MTTEAWLIKNYGILMTMTDLAHLLDRSDDGIRITIQSESELGGRLRNIKMKVGRRVHFKARDIALLIDEGFA